MYVPQSDRGDYSKREETGSRSFDPCRHRGECVRRRYRARPLTKAPVAPPVLTYDWSGIYIGGAVGGAWDMIGGVFYNAFPAFFLRPTATVPLIYGGFAGIRSSGAIGCSVSKAVGTPWIMASTPPLAGLRASSVIYALGSCESRLNDIWYIGGRLGYGWDRFMLYGQGGYARADIDTRDLPTRVRPFSRVASSTHGGWYAGVGGEYAVLDI